MKTAIQILIASTLLFGIIGCEKNNDNTWNCGDPITDYDGNKYSTVQIGNQCWMNENLKTTHYADGSAMIDGTGFGSIWGDNVTKYYFDYDDEPLNSVIYGKLYTWPAVMNNDTSSSEIPSGVQGICPTGWHVPSSLEWNELRDYLYNKNVSGRKLKADGTLQLNSSKTGASNYSDFDFIPGGFRGFDGSYRDIGINYYWSSTAGPWYGFFYYYESLSETFTDKTYGFSARCLKD